MRTWRTILTMASLAIAAWFSTAAMAQPTAKTFRAGVAVVDITPRTLPVSMTGGFTDRQATQVHDPLNVRCLVLDDDAMRLALVVCDSCLISRELFDEAKRLAAQRTGLPTHCMLMSATHTHTAVTVVDLAHCHADRQYNQFLVQQIAQAVVEAIDRLQPASIGWAVEPLASEVSNRRWRMKPGAILPDPFGRTADQVRTNPPVGSPDLIEPAGPTDPEVSIVAVQTVAGKPLALLANYSLHYMGGIPRDALSADYFGEFARQIGEKLGDGQATPCWRLPTARRPTPSATSTRPKR